MTADSYYMPDQPQLYCPSCQADLALARTTRGTARPPKGADLPVCFQCLEFLRYVEPEPGVLRLDVVHADEFESLPEVLQGGLLQTRGVLLQTKRDGEQAQPTRYEAALAVELTALKARVAVLESPPSHACPHCHPGENS